MPSEVISTGTYTLLHKRILDLEAPPKVNLWDRLK